MQPSPKRRSIRAGSTPAQIQQAQQAADQKAAEFKQAFTEKEIALIDATIRKGLAYPASAKLTGWEVLNAEKRMGMVAVEATNVYGSRRSHKLYLFQVNPDGTVIAEPYVRGM